MSRFRLIGFLLAAFAVGVLSQRVGLPAAAAKPVKPAVADTLFAHRIPLVDAQGHTAAVFVTEPSTSGIGSGVALYDGSGQVIWRAGNGLQPLAVGH